MNTGSKLRVAVMISGSGTNLQAIIDAVTSGMLPVEMIAVVSDNPDAYGLQRAATADIPTRVVNYAEFERREDFDAELDRQLAAIKPDLIVLAGYMRIIADATVNNYAGNMINVHPSLLPAYPGLHTYRRVLEAGEQWHGTTVHYVIPQLDAGPPFLQYRIKITASDTEQSLRERVQQGEHLIYPLAIQWIAEGKIRWQDGQLLLDGQRLEAPQLIDED
jgi:phosphoribosylglycinamide formyltransferase-1